MKSDRDVSVIIVSFNTSELTLRCLWALSKTTWGKITKEVIVVDNASTDTTVARIKQDFPDVKVIQNPKNIGFAAGNNVGIRKAKGRYILLLNSDTEVYPLTIPVIVDFMDTHPRAGASTCKLVLPNGAMDPACHRGFPTPASGLSYFLKLEKLFPKTKLFGGYHMGYKNMTVPHEVDCISGAFFFVRSEVVRSVGLLDEEYFMYAEDIDWAYRIKEAGWEIWFNPNTTALHLKKKSGRSHESRIRRSEADTYFYTYNKLFYTKHYKNKYSPLITFLVYALYDIQMWFVRTFGVSV